MSYRCEVCGKEPWVGKQVKDTNGAPRLTSRPPGFSTLRKMMRESSLDAYHFGEREYTAEVTRLEKSDKLATSTMELGITLHAIKITLPKEKEYDVHLGEESELN